VQDSDPNAGAVHALKLGSPQQMLAGITKSLPVPAAVFVIIWKFGNE
jgi:hypothetical protein